jgi:hypothetical protein
LSALCSFGRTKAGARCPKAASRKWVYMDIGSSSFPHCFFGTACSPRVGAGSAGKSADAEDLLDLALNGDRGRSSRRGTPPVSRSSPNPLLVCRSPSGRPREFPLKHAPPW